MYDGLCVEAPSYGTFCHVDSDLAPNSEPDSDTDVDADIKCRTRMASRIRTRYSVRMRHEELLHQEKINVW